MLNFNRIREHFQECEIERLQKRVRQLEEELEAARTNHPTTPNTVSSPQPERPAAAKPAAPSDAVQR